MPRMKTFFIYLILFIAFYLLVDVLVNISTKDNYKDLTNYEVEFSDPEVKITEYKASYSTGHIAGKVTNTTGAIIDNFILKFDFYNSNGSYLGTKYEEVKYFNVNEEAKFNVEFGFEKVDKVKISVTDEKPQDNSIWLNLKPNMNEDIMKLAIPVGVLFAAWYLLP